MFMVILNRLARDLICDDFAVVMSLTEIALVLM